MTNISLFCLLLIVQQSFVVVVVDGFHASLPDRSTRYSRTGRKDTYSTSNFIEADRRLSSLPTTSSSSSVVVLFAISSDEAIERMRAQQEQQQQDRAIMEQEQPPMLFENDMIRTMNHVYDTLEKRIQNGQGSLNTLEILHLEMNLETIGNEMIQNEHTRPTKEDMQKRVVMNQSDDIVSSSKTTLNADKYQEQQMKQNQGFFPQQSPESNSINTNIGNSYQPSSISTNNNEDGPMYDGNGGMGQPRGTVNTYAIPGMEEMTPEEYMMALQQRVIQKQDERRKHHYDRAGNQSTWSYLSTLSGSVEGPLKRKNGIVANDDENDNNTTPRKWKPN